MIVVEQDKVVFVGEVAHIVSATPSGPRSDPSLCDREIFSNLLLLCSRHHKIIDDSDTQDQYPAELLRHWKHEREHELDPTALGRLNRFDDLPDRLPNLLVQSFQETTAELDAAVDRLEDVGLLAHDAAELLRDAVDRMPERGPRLGEGVAGIEAAFQLAYDTAGGASFLGAAAGLAYEDGPGFVQHLRGAACGDCAVICALPGRYAVVVAGELWAAISQFGDPARGGGVNGLGFPAAAVGGNRRYVGPEVSEVEMVGGSWGCGHMVRQPSGTWRWRPEIRFDSNATSDRTIWTAGIDKMDLRLRLAARIPWLPDGLRVNSAGRRRLEAALTESRATEIIRALAWVIRCDRELGPVVGV